MSVELTGISDIEQMAREAMALFDWSAVPLGHPLRIHAYSYAHWGIKITPSNIEALREASRKAYAEEWAPTDESVNELIAMASVRAGLSDTNKLMNEKAGEYSAEHVAGLGGDARIIDIGSGAGGTILAVLGAIHSAGIDLSSLTITLVEPSGKRLAFARDRIAEFALERGLAAPRITALEGTVHDLASIGTDHAHLVVQNAAIHHESFNDHLLEINRVLMPGMPFISGDWHEGSYESPARIYWIYSMLQDPFDDRLSSDVQDFVLGKRRFWMPKERNELREFRSMFSLSKKSLAHAFDGYTKSERRANAGGMRYWLEVAKALTEKGKKSPEALIQAHERVAPRIIALSDAGFCFGPEDRKKYTEVLKAKGFGELGAVMVSRKRAAR